MTKKLYVNLHKRAQELLKNQNTSKKNFSKDISQLIEELTLHQVELEIQNEDLLKTQIDLFESRNKYIELYDLAPIGYFSLNENSIIQEVNQAGCHLLGLNKNSLINRCFTRYISPEHQTLFSQYRKLILKNLSQESFEVKLQRWNSPSFYAMIDFKATLDKHAGKKQLLTFVTDITDRKIKDNDLHQKRIKLAAVNRSHSLHEFMFHLSEHQNHSIAIINNYLNGCIRRLESNDFKTQNIVNALKKIFIQTNKLDEMMHKQIHTLEETLYCFEQVNINTLISQTLQLFNYEMHDYPIIIQYDLDDANLKVKLDVSHIQQVILNIVRNAFEAVRDAKISEPKLLIDTSITEDKMIKVNFSDNGPGIREQLLEKLFEPHFTTKTYAVGLGLSESRSIIEKHGGKLSANFNPFGGACFNFTLPYL